MANPEHLAILKQGVEQWLCLSIARHDVVWLLAVRVARAHALAEECRP
jgi:hypothetical protein